MRRCAQDDDNENNEAVIALIVARADAAPAPQRDLVEEARVKKEAEQRAAEDERARKAAEEQAAEEERARIVAEAEAAREQQERENAERQRQAALTAQAARDLFEERAQAMTNSMWWIREERHYRSGRPGRRARALCASTAPHLSDSDYARTYAHGPVSIRSCATCIPIYPRRRTCESS